MMKRIGFVALLWVAFGLMPALAKDDFLRPEEAYRYTTRFEGQRLMVDWTIEKGYYLYKDRMGVTTAAPDVLFSVQWPKGEDHQDEFFGKQEIYRGQVSIPVEVNFGAARPTTLTLELKLQGCADAGLCYPPTKWKTTTAVPAATTTTVAANATPAKAFSMMARRPEEPMCLLMSISSNGLVIRWTHDGVPRTADLSTG